MVLNAARRHFIQKESIISTWINILRPIFISTMVDSTNLLRLVQEITPDEIYNLGAMSHVKVSFDSPEYTANVDGIGTLRLLEAIRICGL